MSSLEKIPNCGFAYMSNIQEGLREVIHTGKFLPSCKSSYSDLLIDACGVEEKGHKYILICDNLFKARLDGTSRPGLEGGVPALGRKGKLNYL